MTTMAAAVETTLAALSLDVRDTAAAALARAYAASIDALEGEQRDKLIGVIGPSLLRTLEQLGATPVARGEGKTTGITATGGALAALRAVN